MLPQHAGFQDSLNLTISLCLIYTLCVGALRIWIRRTTFGTDDIVVAASNLITLCHTGSDYAALAQGLGLPWAELEKKPSIQGLNEASISGVVTFVVALYLSKCAMLSFLSRITQSKSQIRLYHTCNIIVALIGIASVLIVTVGCPTDSGYYWAFYANKNSCPSQTVRWQTMTGLDIVTETIVLILPVHLVWSLQMPWTKKAMLILAFYLRLPSMGFSIARNYYTLRLHRPTSDAGLDSTLVVIWIEIQLTWALAASTLSALKAFTANFNSSFGLGFTRGNNNGRYGLSIISGNSSGQSNKSEEKSKESTVTSGAEVSRVRSPDIEAQSKARREYHNHSGTIPIDPLAHEPLNLIPADMLKLRPSHENLRCVTHVCADPNGWPPHEGHSGRDGSSVGSHGDEGNMVIYHNTGYEIHHDTSPILGPYATFRQ